MNIVVCVKQVPNIAALKFDPVKKTLVREGVPNEVSSFDIRALLRAVDLVREHGGEVVALTMGPPQAAQALQHCLALGAHRAVHLCDRAFAGADTLATARALALAIKREKFDLVFCGRYSVDAETGQVGPEVAEFLDIAQVTAARAITVKDGVATVERETDEGFETVEVRLPLLLTAAEDLAPERFPMKKDREAAKTKTITTVTASELSSDLSQFGLAGSPTSVKEIRSVESKRKCQFVTVEELVPKLLELGLFGRWKDARVQKPARRSISGPDIWVVGEVWRGHHIRPVTYELLGAATELGRAAAVLIGHNVAGQVRGLAQMGAERVFLADDPDLAAYRTEPYADLVARAIQAHKPHSVLIPSTAIGRDLAPRVAARLGLGLTGDAIGLEMDGDALVQLKPAFGGRIVAPIISQTFPRMATVRPGILSPVLPDPSRSAEVVRLSVPGLVSRVRVVASRADPESDAAFLDLSSVVVGFGIGIGGPENMPKIRELAKVLSAPLATTRDVTDKGWLPRQHQVGLTGKSIAPCLYFAIGIRGAFEHTVGIQKAGTVVAINNDDQAWIWDSADFGVKGDWAEIVPKLTAALKR